jgi:PKD repeat protein
MAPCIILYTLNFTTLKYSNIYYCQINYNLIIGEIELNSKNLIMVLAGVLLLCLCIVPVNAATWTVCPGGSCSFTEISAAIASPSVNDGDSLLVDGGTYQPFVVSKALTIIGPHTGGDPVVHGSGTQIAITITDAPVVIDGFSVDTVPANSNTCIFSQTGTVMTQNTLRDIELNQCGMGMWIQGDYNTIDTCTFNGGPYGINIYGANNRIENSIFDGMTSTGVAIMDTSAGGNYVQNNIFRNMPAGSTASAIALSGPWNYILDNNFENNWLAIVTYPGGGDNSIINNRFWNSPVNGEGVDNIWNQPGMIPGTNIVGGPRLGGNWYGNTGGTGWSQTCTADGYGICTSPYKVVSSPLDYDYYTLADTSALHLRLNVVNDNGGTAAAADWTLHAGNPLLTPLAGPTPLDSGAGFLPGLYALSASGGPAGYTASAWVCDGPPGTLAGNDITVLDHTGPTCTITMDDIAPATPPVAAFTATSPTFGEAPIMVSFSDSSTNSPTSRAWFFGDETYSGAWTQLPIDPLPGHWFSERGGHSTVVMPDGSIVLMGGIANGNSLNDVWRSTDNGATWTRQTASAEWSPRNHHTSVVMPNGDIILMGGGAGFPITKLDDVWRSTDQGIHWTQLPDAPWGERQELTSVVMPNGDIVVIGGVETGVNPPNGWTNDSWISTNQGVSWTQQTANAGWTARYGQSSNVMPDGSIVMIGGFDGSFKNDVWRSTDSGVTWNKLPDNTLTVRNRHSTVVMPDGSIVLMGGYDTPSDLYLNDVWRSTDNGVTWIQVKLGAWSSGLQASEAAVMRDGSIILTGGYGPGITFKNDVWRLNPTGSSAQNPSHTYTTPGIYQVALQVCNAGGCDSIQKKAYVSVPQPNIFSPPVINGVNVVLKNKLNYETTGVSVIANPQVQNAPNVPLYWGESTNQPSLQFNVPQCSLVAIDHGPNANGERPIDYLCVDQAGVIKDEQHANAPPTDLAFTQAAGEPLDVGEDWIPHDPDAWEPTCAENCNNYYALLIDGGTDANNNYRRYWNDIAFMYIALREYGYAADHITVLMSDGTSTAADRCIAVSGTTCTQTQDSPRNLDGIGGDETITAASRANVLDKLRTLKTGLTSSQNLFIFTTGHGGGDNTGNSNLKLWNNEQITDADFFNALYGTGVADSVTQTANSADPNGIPSITMVMEQCQGYGFKGEFAPSGATGNRVITTAANYNEPSYGNLFSNAWTVGVAGHTRYFPTTFDLSADSSGDKRVTTAEAYTYAVAHDSVATAGTEHPQKYALGSERFMNDCGGTATKSITVTLPTATGIRWAQSSPHEIQWTEDGLTGTVNIYLVKGGVEQSPAIATGVSANQGIYRWTVPDSQTAGTDYKIRVRTSDSVTIGNSVNNFEIYAKSGTDANNKGTLVFSTNPTGASIFLDGSTTQSGTTTSPLTVSGLMQGDHRVVVKLSGYYDQSYLVTVTAQSTNTLPTWILDKIETSGQNGPPLDWSPYGGMDIMTDPIGAEIWIDKLGDTEGFVDRGAAPALLELPPGAYKVYATKALHQPSETKDVTVESYSLLREPVRVDLTLKPSTVPTVTGIAPASGPLAGGTSVTISGTDFTGATAVHFGSTSASGFLVDSATQITATSPAGTGIVDVTVTTPSGTSSVVAGDQFTYKDNVVPVVEAGTDATITRGSTFSQGGSFTDPDTNTWTATVNYGDGTGNQQLALTGKIFTLSHKYVNAGKYTVTVKVDDNAGGVGTDTAIVKVGYTFAGFYQPIDMGKVTNEANAGKTIPVKWQLSDANGPVNDPASFLNLTSSKVNCGTTNPLDAIEEYSAGNSGLQYLGNGNWQYNWKTDKTYAGTCRLMYINFNSGETSLQTTFKFK